MRPSIRPALSPACRVSPASPAAGDPGDPSIGEFSPAIWIDASNPACLFDAASDGDQVTDEGGQILRLVDLALGYEFVRVTSGCHGYLAKSRINGRDCMLISPGKSTPFYCPDVSVSLDPYQFCAIWVGVELAHIDGAGFFSLGASGTGEDDNASATKLVYHAGSPHTSGFGNCLEYDSGFHDSKIFGNGHRFGVHAIRGRDSGLFHYRDSATPLTSGASLGSGLIDDGALLFGRYVSAGIGLTKNFSGYFCEFALFNYDVADEDFESIMSILTEKWGGASTRPTVPIPANASLAYRISDSASVLGSGGSPVTALGGKVDQVTDSAGTNHARQTTDGSRPTYIPCPAGRGFLYCPGLSGNGASQAHSSYSALTGDCAFEFHLAAVDWTPPSVALFCFRKYSTTGYMLRIKTDGKPEFVRYSSGAFRYYTGTIAVPFTDGVAYAFRCRFDADNGAGGSDAYYEYAPYHESTGAVGAWTLLEKVTVAAAGPTAFDTADYYIGSDSGASMLHGRIFRHIIYDDVAATSIVQDIDFSKCPHGAVTVWGELTGPGAWTVASNSRIIRAGEIRMSGTQFMSLTSSMPPAADSTFAISYGMTATSVIGLGQSAGGDGKPYAPFINSTTFQAATEEAASNRSVASTAETRVHYAAACTMSGSSASFVEQRSVAGYVYATGSTTASASANAFAYFGRRNSNYTDGFLGDYYYQPVAADPDPFYPGIEFVLAPYAFA